MASTVVAPATAQSDTDAFTIDAESAPSTAEVTLTGTTTLDPGTELLVRVQSTGDTEPAFLRSTTTTVGPDGEWNATFDLSAVETHDRASVTVSAAEGDASETFEVSLRDDRDAGTDDAAPVSTPGFGVAVAVAALLGSAALFARGRR